MAWVGPVRKIRTKRGNRWRFEWEIHKTVNGKRVREHRSDTFLFPETANQKREEKRAELAGEVVHPAPGKCTIAALKDAYFDAKRGQVQDDTLDYGVAPAFEGLMRRFGEHSEAEQLPPRELNEWKKELLTKRKKSGVRRSLSYLRTAFHWARTKAKPRLIRYNPFDDIELPEEEKTGRLIVNAEIRALFRAMHGPSARVVRFLLYTGMRRSEGLRLDWRDVAEIKRGKTRMWVARILRTTKKKNVVERMVPLHRKAVELMGERKEHGHVFEQQTPMSLTRAVARAGQRAHLGNVKLKDLRHTWNTRAGEIVEWPRLKQWAGHVTDWAASRYQHPNVDGAALINQLDFGLDSTPLPQNKPRTRPATNSRSPQKKKPRSSKNGA